MGFLDRHAMAAVSWRNRYIVSLLADEIELPCPKGRMAAQECDAGECRHGPVTKSNGLRSAALEMARLDGQ
jgi:hypothetical protein